ncbi:hypothetical protein B9Z55_025785 [Caenorhabditis nigoni]|uniref:Uncharacterized protein n=1 Tax=Caenorhabditis nigoni TaxID=1611254 RepID=A0A2G5T0A7_9PELO|nr:hypothetical protein B9Z55_025785 [Caenorhabditis nigoni]
MSGQPEDVESNNEDEVPLVLSRELLRFYNDEIYRLDLGPYLFEMMDSRVRESAHRDMRALDAKLGRNFRSLLRGTISKGIHDRLPPKMISYLNDVSVEELIQFLGTWNQEQWTNTTTIIELNACFRCARKYIKNKNNAIISYQQWDVNDYHECFEDILKDVFYLYAKYGEMFVRALTQFIKQLCTVFCTHPSFAEESRAKKKKSNKHCCGTEKKEESPYNAERLFFHCLNCILEYQTQEYCGYALRVLTPWLDGAKKALDKSNADLHPYDRKHIRNQQKLNMAGSKIEKNENGLFVLKKCVAEDARVLMQIDGVKSEISKEGAKKRRLVVDMTKSKKQAVASTTNEVASAFHRFTPFPNKGGFTHYPMRI